MNKKRKIATVSLLVDDYDKAIDFYTNALSFSLIEDTKLTDSKRWVLVAPQESECTILLAKASDEEQKKYIGKQTGGRVFLFLHTDNLERDYKNLLTHHVKIIREPSEEIYGKVLVFQDIYGNLWDLIEPK